MNVVLLVTTCYLKTARVSRKCVKKVELLIIIVLQSCQAVENKSSEFMESSIKVLTSNNPKYPGKVKKKLHLSKVFSVKAENFV